MPTPATSPGAGYGRGNVTLEAESSSVPCRCLATPGGREDVVKVECISVQHHSAEGTATLLALVGLYPEALPRASESIAIGSSVVSLAAGTAGARRDQHSTVEAANQRHGSVVTPASSGSSVAYTPWSRRAVVVCRRVVLLRAESRTRIPAAVFHRAPHSHSSRR